MALTKGASPIMLRRKNYSRTGTFKTKQAPGDLRIVQDFVNTRDVEVGKDELTDPEALSAWLTQRGWLAAETPLDKAAWKNALEIREALRDQLRRHSAVKLEDDPAQRLEAAFGDVRARVRLEAGAVVRLEAFEPGWLGVRSRLLAVIYEAIRLGRWTRLKACYRDACQWVFYDDARNATGKWCTVRRCGNWVNSATYRRKKRGRP